jgi:hypothetical protein
MPRCASSHQWLAIRDDGGDAGWLTFLQAMKNIAILTTTMIIDRISWRKE